MRRDCVLATLLVGMTLGAAEIVWVLKGLKSVPAGDLALLFFYSCIGYGLVAALAVTLSLPVERYIPGIRISSPDILWSRAVGFAVGTFASIHFVLALVLFGETQLVWFTPGCILSGALVGLLAAWIASRISILQRLSTWTVLSAFFLLLGLGIAAFNHELISALESEPVITNTNNKQTNILLISVDTLRRDRLGCYGFKTAQTPHIDRLAHEGLLFEDATSPIPLTGPSHVTMLTGLYPWNHGVSANGVSLRGSTTLPEMLSRSGYSTAAFISGWTLKDYSTSLANRFEYYDEDLARWPGFPDILLRVALPKLFVRATMVLTGSVIFQLERPAQTTTSRALSWLSSHKDRPFFMFVHYFDPHEPHLPPPPYDRAHVAAARGDHPDFQHNRPKKVREQIISDPVQVEHLKALYDGEITYVDEEIGRLLKGIESFGFNKNLMIIFTADHGQSLTEHESYFRHGEFLYETCVRVPLIIRMPDGSHAGTRYSNQVRLADLTPTVLSVIGIKSKLKFDGISLLPIIHGTEHRSRTSYGAIQQLKGEHARSRYYVRENGFKLIWNFDLRKEFSDVPVLEEFYDLKEDPDELNNLAFTSSPLLDSLRKLMTVHARHERIPADIPDEEVREALESLGYL